MEKYNKYHESLNIDCCDKEINKPKVKNNCCCDGINLPSHDNEIEVLITSSQIRFRMGEIEITSKLIDASFPDYRQLIPKDCTNKIELDKAELIRMTKVAALFARDNGGSIVCEASKESQSFSISAVASELGENTSAMEANVSEDGKVVLNSRYLLDALNATVEGKVVFGLSGKLAPVTIKNAKSDDYTHIIMPLKS